MSMLNLVSDVTCRLVLEIGDAFGYVVPRTTTMKLCCAGKRNNDE